MSRGNPLWGAERIRGELLKLGIVVSNRSIRRHRWRSPNRVGSHERHLHTVLTEYVRYYNHDRPHRSLAHESPVPREVIRDGPIVSRPILGGLHHAYARAA